MPTVKQLLKDLLPAGTRVVAGKTGLYGEVSWVVTLRPSPPAFDSLKGNEFVIVGTDAASGLGVTLTELITTLAERKAGAIGVLGQVTTRACQEAQSRGMPLMQLPPQTNIASVEAGITHLINEERQHLYQKEHQFSQTLMELAVAGGGAAAITEKLKELTGRIVGFIDLDLKPLFPLDQKLTRGFRNVVPPALSRLRYASSSAVTPVIGLDLTPEYGCFISPVKVGRETKGYLMLVAPEGEISEADRLAVRVGTLALAVEMSRRQAAEETEGRFEVDIVEALITGDSPTQTFGERAKKLDLDLSLPYVAMVANLMDSSPDQGTIIRKVISLLPKKPLCYFRGDDLIVLSPVASLMTIAESRQFAEKFARDLTENMGKAVTLGIGRSYPGPQGIKLSYEEAKQALTMGVRLFGAGSVTSFGDLGIYRLLFSLKSNSELRSFYQEYLGRLSEYDQKHEGELLQTLKAYLRYNTMAETARAIHVHRNTLLYRLERIREITGFDIEDGEMRLTLHLALLAGEIIRAS